MTDAWVPQIADAEQPTVIDVVVEGDAVLDYLGPDHDRAVVAVPLADGTYAVAIQDGPRPTDDRLTLPETIAEGFATGDRVRLFGRWARVQLMPPEADDWPSGRMFVIDRYELID